LLGGGSHNSIAVEFKEFIAVFEAPLDEERSLAVIEEVVRLIPDKPIRWAINSHQHFDHVGGLRTYMHIGATIVTHWKNYDFYNRDVLNYAQRTLKPDMLSLWPPTELSEGYYYEAIRENFIISDGTRNLNVHYVNPLAHVEGMLIAYLPKEKLLFEADLLDTDRPMPAAPTPDQKSFVSAVRKLGLNVSQVVPVHGRPASWTEFESFVDARPPSRQH
jgi:glyoxylase-like metal-dependent hydrolase (beta-lactamase superfamily II)